jgi:hypothetical protein
LREEKMEKIVKGKGKEAVTRAKTAETNNANKIYQIKISLVESQPEIWRRKPHCPSFTGSSRC